MPVLDCPSAVWISLLGGFQLVGSGQLIGAQRAGKLESLLVYLVLARERGVSREALLAAVWPDTPLDLAGQSLNSLVHTARLLLAEHTAGEAPIVVTGGTYRLNAGAGVSSDVDRFDALVMAGNQQLRAGNTACAAQLYEDALGLYRGDLCASTDIALVLERERLRAEYLTLLSRLSDYWFGLGEYEAALSLAHRLLQADPCREDAYRRTMQTHARLGQRAQALRQYRLCERILRAEFDVEPEPATMALFEALRVHPERV